MVERKRKASAAAIGESGIRVSASDKIASLLALMATREMETEVAALKLDAIGFNAREISAILDVGPNYVNVARHRKKAPSRKPRKKG